MAIAASPRHREAPAPARLREQVDFRRFARTREPRLRDELIERHLPLANSVARRFATTRDGHEDLQQVAAVALVHAVDRFDPERGTTFSTFAVPTIAGEIRRHLRDHDWGVRPPRRLYELSTRSERTATLFEQRHRRAPSPAELARRLDCAPEELMEAFEAMRARRWLSLEAPIARSGEAGVIGDLLVSEDDSLERSERIVALQHELRRLPRRARRVVVLRFFGDLSQTEIAARLGISQMQVSRTLRESLKTLSSGA